MVNYEVRLDLLEKAKIKPRIGEVIVLKLGGGKKIDAKITRVETERVIATSS